MEIDIITGNKKILATGTFLTISAKDNLISIVDDKVGKINIELNFVEEKDGNKTPSVELKSKSDNSAGIMTLNNFNQPVGLSLDEPILIATSVPNKKGIDNIRKIYLNVFVRTNPSNIDMRKITYTFYFEDVTDEKK